MDKVGVGQRELHCGGWIVSEYVVLEIFFFQAEDGIRDKLVTGVQTCALPILLGVGGGFILVPAMIYLLGMAPRVVIGTSLVMILAVSAGTTMIHAVTTRAVDIVLAALLLIGGVVGAQYGAILTTRIKPDLLRLALAIIILLVALRMALGLAWRPDEIFSIEYL